MSSSRFPLRDPQFRLSSSFFAHPPPPPAPSFTLPLGSPSFFPILAIPISTNSPLIPPSSNRSIPVSLKCSSSLLRPPASALESVGSGFPPSTHLRDSSSTTPALDHLLPLDHPLGMNSPLSFISYGVDPSGQLQGPPFTSTISGEGLSPSSPPLPPRPTNRYDPPMHLSRNPFVLSKDPPLYQFTPCINPL